MEDLFSQVGYNWNNNEFYTLSLTFDGTTISGSINGIPLPSSVTDASFAAGKIGLTTETSAANFDNVTVVEQ